MKKEKDTSKLPSNLKVGSLEELKIMKSWNFGISLYQIQKMVSTKHI